MKDEKFTLGYTYNDLPFHISKGVAFTGPTPINKSGVVNFVFHPSQIESTNIFFNSHGKSSKIFTRIIDGDSVNEADYKFPTSNKENLKEKSEKFITNIAVTKKMLEKSGDNPEILISIRST